MSKVMLYDLSHMLSYQKTIFMHRTTRADSPAHVIEGAHNTE
jgi:kynurenine formamidase